MNGDDEQELDLGQANLFSSRRELLALGGLGMLAAPAKAAVGHGSHIKQPRSRGPQGERRADLGDGTFLNPVLPGDHPDPSILKDGNVYYKVSSSFDYYPGLVVWRSEDLVNWQPAGPTLHKLTGCVFAPDLVKHEGRYFIYFPTLNIDNDGGPRPYDKSIPPLSNWVIHADEIGGPWSDPVNLPTGALIDPGHVVGEDGKRYLFFSRGYRVQLSDDGLALIGKPKKVYDGWPIPDAWVIEGFELEGPKLLRRDGWFYMFSAQGGTGGPPTSHMVVVARSRSVHGPWENCPHNPIVHTSSIDEPWWSRGHATPVEGPHGEWWLIYHGYENGFRTLGRQMLLEPMVWTADGWPRATGGDLSRPMRKPSRNGAASSAITSVALTDAQFGSHLTIYRPAPGYQSGAAFDSGAVRLASSGPTVKDMRPLVLNVGEHSYAVTVELELEEGATGGLFLFYNKRAFCGLAMSEAKVQTYKNGKFSGESAVPAEGRKAHLRVVNNRNVASFYISRDGATWRRAVSFEVSGYNHNVFDQFLSLRPALFAIGDGSVQYRRLSFDPRNHGGQTHA